MIDVDLVNVQGFDVIKSMNHAILVLPTRKLVQIELS